MPRNNDVYSPPSGTGGTPQTPISSTMFNAYVADITADLNAARPIVAGGTGATTAQGAIDNFFAAARTIKDDKLTIVDPSDTTKRVRLDAGNVTAGQTRVLTMPDADVSITSKAAELLDDTTTSAMLTTLGVTSAAATVLDDTTTRAMLKTLGVTITPQCYLRRTSGGMLSLEAHSGNLAIDGAGNILTVPSSGLTLAATDLTPATMYYIYAYDNDGDGAIDTLEASTTSFVSSSNAIPYKTGATDRILVGMAYCVTGPAWSSNATEVLSYYNRKPKSLTSSLTADRSTSSTTFVEVHSEIRTPFVVFSADDVVEATANGWTTHPSGTGATSGIAFDDGTSPEAPVCRYHSADAVLEHRNNDGSGPLAVAVSKTGLTAGRHYATLSGKVTGYSVQWHGDVDPCTLTVTVWG